MNAPCALACAVLLVSACDRPAQQHDVEKQLEAPSKVSKPPSKDEASPPPTPDDDPLLLAVCHAYDEVVAEQVPGDRILQHTALRAVERHGVTEAQLAELGATPAALLASMRARGNPEACGPFVTALEDMSGG